MQQHHTVTDGQFIGTATEMPFEAFPAEEPFPIMPAPPVTGAVSDLSAEQPAWLAPVPKGLAEREDLEGLRGSTGRGGAAYSAGRLRAGRQRPRDPGRGTGGDRALVPRPLPARRTPQDVRGHSRPKTYYLALVSRDSRKRRNEKNVDHALEVLTIQEMVS